MKIKALLLFAAVGLFATAFAYSATEWSTQDYDLYPGDFNADGRTDLLYVAKDPSASSGIALSDGSGPNGAGQSWSSNYLGIPWYGNLYGVVVSDFNADGSADIFLQRKTPGDHYLLFADERGKISGIAQTIPNNFLGLVWSADQHRVKAGGDFNGDGYPDLFLQPSNKGGLSAVVLSFEGGGAFGLIGQSWSDGYLGFNWSAQESEVYAGNFNGDGQCDLLVRALPKLVTVDYDIPIPVPTFTPNTNGIVYARAVVGGSLFNAAGVQAWSRNAFGVDWAPIATNLITGDFNGDGRVDVLLQARNSSSPSHLLTANASGASFANGVALASNVTWSANSYRLIVGNFDRSGGAGIFFQTTTPGGTNHYTNTVTGSSVSVAVHNAAALTGVVAATAVGRTPGAFAVTDTGMATYSIPVVVPPGVSGVQPSLAIAYGSTVDNGLLGVGWSLSGLGVIDRCRKTMAQDNATDGVTLTNADRFCLNGDKLRLTGGVYGKAGSTYQTEHEQFARVTAYGSVSSGEREAPAYFVVETKSGLKYEYGNSIDSRIEGRLIATPRVWALNRMTDRDGNSMVVTYTEDIENGSFRPNEILYTSNAAAGLSAAFKVVFQWETRPGNEAITEYVAFNLIRETRRLSRIEAQYADPSSGGAFRLVRRYQLSYNQTGMSAHSRLGAIQECDRNLSCLAPTMISWQDGQVGMGPEFGAVNLGSLAQYALPIDVNADGRADVVFPSGTTWWYAIAASTGSFATPQNTGIPHNNRYTIALPIDYNVDGRMDLLTPDAINNWQVLISLTSGGFGVSSTGIEAAQTPGQTWVADVQGDGESDLLYVSGNTLYVRYNDIGEFGNAVPVFTPSQQILTQTFQSGTDTFRSAIQFFDANGDGRTDVLVPVLRDNGDGNGAVALWELVSTGLGYDSDVIAEFNAAVFNSASATLRAMDINGDGLSDLAYRCPNAQTWCIRFGTGAHGVTAEFNTGVSAPSTLTNVIELDWDGDGRTDLLQSQPNNYWELVRSTGDTLAPVVETFVFTNDASRAMTADVNGDGLPDLVYSDSSNAWHYRARVGGYPDLVSAIADGFGNNVTISYASLTDSTVYTKGTTALFPEIDVQSPMQVVKQYTATDAIGGTYTVSESYVGARVHMRGRGFLGFRTRTETDSRNGVRSSWLYNQSYPLTGTVVGLTLSQPNGNVASHTNYGYRDLVTNSTLYNDRHFVYAESVVTTKSEVNASDPSVDGQPVNRTIVATTVDSYGNPTNVTVTTVDLVNNGPNFTTQTVNTIPSFDTTNWCLDFVTQKTATSTIPNTAAVTRTIQYVKDMSAPTQCRPSQEIIEPSQADQRVTTTFGYDSFGHVSNKRVAAAGMDDRVTQIDYGLQGLLPISVTNALNEKATKDYDFALGMPVSETDPNSVNVTWQFDGFGRKTLERRPDGTATRWMLYACNVGNQFCGDSLLRAQVSEQRLDSSGSIVTTALQRLDAQERVIYVESQTLSGAMAVVKTNYDNLGRVRQRSAPYFSGFSPLYTTFSYDLTNRPLREERRVSEIDASTQTTQFSYSKLTRTATDANGKVITKVLNAIGQTVQVTDAANGVTRYTYDSFGLLKQTTDPSGNLLTAQFNSRGFKTSSSNPDMGNWTYEYYPTGELKKQTDAAGQVATFTYDSVSRLRTRTEVEGTTTWTYGTSVTSKNIGKLDTVSSPGGYSESYAYDSIGRPQTITTVVDGTSYPVISTYSATTGFVNTITYPTSTSGVPGSRFKVQYDYAYGILQRVKNFNTPDTVYWEEVATNAAGQAINEQYGNGLHTYSTFDSITGLPTARTTGSSNQIQNLSYQWDKMGNLTERKDGSLNLTEQLFTTASIGLIIRRSRQAPLRPRQTWIWPTTGWATSLRNRMSVHTPTPQLRRAVSTQRMVRRTLLSRTPYVMQAA